MATAKVHKRKANHNRVYWIASSYGIGWLLRRYINGKPITTALDHDNLNAELDGYCEGT